MGRSITGAAAQTGPVTAEDIASGIDTACGMVAEAARPYHVRRFCAHDGP